MDLQKKSFTELQEAFDLAVQDWRENIYQMEMVKEKECVKYADYARNRADLRQLARENAKLHDLITRIDLEMQIRTWAGLND